jgi:hypothetical protein
MARKELTQFQRARLSRRLGGIDQLATQYQQNIQQITGEYQQAFGQYQEGVTAKMVPYEAALSQYQSVDFPAYQEAAARYQSELDAYNRELEALAANPVTERVERVKTGETWYGKSKYSYVTFFDPKPIPEFTDRAPSAPSAPSPPTIEPFDTSEFDQNRTQAQSTYQREVGERRGARMNAVSRRSARPLMQGA